ncbi:hypothetical protein OAE87_01535 [bacterium]|nr:hypothetical protein [bacterium]
MTLSIVTASLNAFDNLFSMYERIKSLLGDEIDWVICDSIRSVDDTASYFQSMPYVSVLTVDDDGIYDAINQGILIASGEWIIILGSDDLIFPPIKDLLNCFSPAEFIYSLPYSLGDSSYVHSRSPNTIFHFLRGMPLSHQCLVVSKKLYVKFLYVTSYKYASDYHWLLNVFLHGYRPVRVYHSSPAVNMSLSGISSSIYYRALIAEEFLHILRGFKFPIYLRLPLILSLWKTRIRNYSYHFFC